MTETKAIHPNPAGATHAESPYTRKLRRISDDVKLVQALASFSDAARLELILVELSLLIKGE